MSDSEIIQLVDELNGLCGKLDHDLSINSGGCCYVAGIVAEGLYKLHIPYKVAITKCFEVEKSLEVRRFIKNKQDFYCQHAFIYLHKHKLYINDDGDADRNVKVGCIKPKELLEYYKSTRWNKTYNIRNNKSVAKSINEIFKKYESKA